MATNFEYYKEEILKIVGSGCGFSVAGGKVKPCVGTPCYSCIFSGDCVKHRIDWLYEEHAEPIKLTEWEYKALKACEKGYREDIQFCCIYFLVNLKHLGCFENINDTTIQIKEIIERAEVIDLNSCDGCKYKLVSNDDAACRCCRRWYVEDLYERA